MIEREKLIEAMKKTVIRYGSRKILAEKLFRPHVFEWFANSILSMLENQEEE